MSEVIDLPPELVKRVGIEEFGTDLRREQVARLGELMVTDGLLEHDPDIDGLMP
ncbi:MAG: hypothetical protein ACRDQ7_08390 [Haloechinothrix sp.]